MCEKVAVVAQVRHDHLATAVRLAVAACSQQPAA